MKKTLLVKLSLASLMAMASVVSFAGGRYTYTFDVKRPSDATEATSCTVKQTLVKSLVGAKSLSALSLKAAWTSSSGKETFYTGNTTGNDSEQGHWFSKSGIATAKSKNYCIKVVWDAPEFQVSHNAEANAEVGNTYTVKEAFVYNSDTIVYVFNVTIGEAGSAMSVTDDQPVVMGRKSTTDGWLVRPVVRQNEQDPKHENFIQVNAGDKITLGCEIIDKSKYVSGKYQWSKCYWDASKKKNVTKSMRAYKDEDFVLTENAEYGDGGQYKLTVRLTDTNNKLVIKSYYYYVDVQEKPGELVTWPTYTQLTYDFHTEYPSLARPTKVHNFKKQNGKPANYYASEYSEDNPYGGWWSAFWGDNLNKEVGTDSATVYGAAKNMVDKYDYDFYYMREVMGWPPDLSARNGYKSFVYVFGSGLSNDNTSNTEQGGYQSATSVDGGYYACVWASYYPFSRFRDDADSKWSDGEYQRNAMIHEGIHAIFADLNACQGSSWFHEGGNSWLQGQVYAERDGLHGTAGYLNAGAVLVPHMPIECYSGWLQDGSYGGPAAQRVNMYNSSGQQVCTWRNLIGGVQYADAFPFVLSQVCGNGVVPWIWRNCKNRVLETIGGSIGDENMRDIITQYRARLAWFDLGEWRDSYRQVAINSFGTSVKAEWSPYWIDVEPTTLTPYQSVELNDSAGWMAPDTLTNPGWSGANYIPIHVSGDVANVEFRPEDTSLRALLCYADKNGTCYYSQPVRCGNMSIDLSHKPANGVITCVVVNTDYVYTGEEQLKHHWDYRLRLGKGSNAVAATNIQWYRFEKTLTDPAYEELISGIETVKADEADPYEHQGVKVLSSDIRPGSTVHVDLNGADASGVELRVVGASGVVVSNGKVNADGSFVMPTGIPTGLYIVTFEYDGNKDVVKLFVR